MTVGESIQKLRKKLGMSQEELGQKLLVSRQTVSLWEKDQTVPTIDNLLRLKEVFGVSTDEILGAEDRAQNGAPEPNEVCQFHFTKEELNEIHRLQRSAVYKRPFWLTLAFVLFILYLIGSSAPDFMVGLVFGCFFISIVSHIKGIRAYNKAWKNNKEQICISTYEYKLFDDHIAVHVYRNNELIRGSKCYYADIEQIQQFDKWLIFQFGGQSFVVRKSGLKENSAFYSYMYKNPSKTTNNIQPNKWRVLSIVLFVASLLSILGALALVGAVSSVNGLFEENMWLFFLLTPIPLASTVFGFVLKAKGYRYKKNIIAGIIMTFFLCLYGSFTFMF